MMLTMYDPLSGNMYGFDDSVITKLITMSCYSKADIDVKLAAVLKLCGSKSTYDDLPKSGQEIGDVWIVEDEHAEYAWVKSLEWEKLGPVINLEGYATQSWVSTLVGTLPNGYSTVTAYIAAVSSVASNALPAATFNQFVTECSNAIANAKKAGDDAAAALDTYKTSNDQAVQTAQSTANAALPKTDFETFKTSNTQAIQDAKKAGTDANSALETYKTSNDQAVQAAKKAGDDAQSALDEYKTSNNSAVQAAQSKANAALPKSDFDSFKTTNTEAINAAKKSGDDAQEDIDAFEQAQLVFESTAAAIEELLAPTEKVETQDVYFSRRKTYYKLEDEEYVALVLGTDYDAMSPVADFGDTVYEVPGFQITQIVSKVNELVAAGNTLIAAHKQAEVEEEEVVE